MFVLNTLKADERVYLLISFLNCILFYIFFFGGGDGTFT